MFSNLLNFGKVILTGSGHNYHNGCMWKECECGQERYPHEQHRIFLESFEGEIVLYGCGRKDYKTISIKKYVVCVMLNSKGGLPEDVVIQKLKLGKLLLAH